MSEPSTIHPSHPSAATPTSNVGTPAVNILSQSMSMLRSFSEATRLRYSAGMGSVRDMPPRGHYLAHEVGRLAGVSGRMIGQWARRGYIKSSQSDGPPRVYSYQDVAEAMVVHALLEHYTSHKAIKDAIRWLREKHGSSWPLSQARRISVPTDQGWQHYVPHRPDELAPSHRKRKRSVIVGDIDTAADHPVLENVDLMRIAVDLHRGGWAARDMEDLKHIEVDPDRLSGRPVIRGLRVPAEDVARLAKQPEGRRILHEEYGLQDDQIADAVRWWDAVAEFAAAA